MSLPFSTTVGVNFSNTFQTDKVFNSDAASQINATGVNPVKMFVYDQSEFMTDATNLGLSLIPGIPNDKLEGLAKNDPSTINDIVSALSPFKSHIQAIMVGNEPLLKEKAALYGSYLADALNYLDIGLKAASINVPLSIPFNSSVESVSWPPSKGAFTTDGNRDTYIKDVCSFLVSKGYFFTINLYPFYAHKDNSGDVPLDYCMFDKKTPKFTDQYTNLAYYNVFESMYDATYFALNTLDPVFGDLPIVVGECGWPTLKGLDASEPNAAKFNQGLIDFVNSGKGTPKFPGLKPQVFLFEMYDEDLKPGEDFEHYWGVYEQSSVGSTTYKAKYTLNWKS